jgi:hypothetical protein
LVNAAVQQIHLLDRTITDSERSRLTNIVDALQDQKIPVAIVSANEAVVHVWSCSDDTEDGSDTQQGSKVIIHGRGSTLSSLENL